MIDALERGLALGQGALDHEREVLSDYGNMSAPTALFVLERLAAAGLPDRTLLTAMGPGFTASCVSLSGGGVTLAALVLALVTAERLGELWLARRNTAGLLARGAYEVRPGHYPLIVALHAAWLAGLWLWGASRPVDLGWLAVFAVLQGLRLWVLGTLGRRWTTRIIVLPGAPLVSGGPFRFFSHPNYLVVIGEIAVLPLALGPAVVRAGVLGPERYGPRHPDRRRERRAGRVARWTCPLRPPPTDR